MANNLSIVLYIVSMCSTSMHIYENMRNITVTIISYCVHSARMRMKREDMHRLCIVVYFDVSVNNAGGFSSNE